MTGKSQPEIREEQEMTSARGELARLGTFVAIIIAMTFGLSAQDMSIRGAGAQVSGHGTVHTARQVVSTRDIARISYPATQTSAEGVDRKSTETVRPRSVLLIEPRRFDREGVYIWRDAEGVWQIQAVSDQKLTLTGRLETEQSIAPQAGGVHAAAGISVDSSKPNAATLAVADAQTSKAATVQFKAEGAYIDLSLQIDGKADPSRIYLGSRGINPQAIPFRLENRPIEVPKPSGKVGAESPQPAAQAAKAAVKAGPDGKPQASSPGGGSGGGSGGRAAPKPTTP